MSKQKAIKIMTHTINKSEKMSHVYIARDLDEAQG